MQVRWRYLCFSLFFLVLSSTLHGESSESAVVDSAIAAIKPSLVRIHVVTVYDDQGHEAKFESAGSGVIITTEGHIITNHHVAGRAKRIVCTLANKEEIEADLVGTDPLSDISIIKLQAENEVKFPCVRFGDSDDLTVGERVFAMGSPLALSQSVTMGIVSNTELVMPELLWPFRFTLEGEDVGSLVRWIGHDAAIFPGNSGGPLVNLQGEVVGINEISLGIGGAIPGNLAQRVARELIDHGQVTRSWFGLEIQPLLQHTTHREGALVSGTIAGSPADKAGFRSGDVLVRFNDQDIHIRFLEELPAFNQLMMECPVGKAVEAVVMRNGKKVTLTAVPVDREYVLPRSVEIKEWGITARNISLFLAKEMKRDNQDGVMVTSVRPSGPCGVAKPIIASGDVIVKINDTPVKNVEDLLALTHRLIPDEDVQQSVLVTFERRDESHITAVRIGLLKPMTQGEQLRKAWLGIAFQVFTADLAVSVGAPEYRGIRITQLFPGSPAERGGLKVGDVIIAVDDIPVEVSEPTDIDVFPVMIRRYDVGAKVVMKILRNGRERVVPVELGRSPVPPSEVAKFSDEHSEFVVRDIAFMDRITMKWDGQISGVIVDAVTNGGWAALANISYGDLIVEVDGRVVHDVDAFKSLMKDITDRKQSPIVLKVLRGIHYYYVEMEPTW